MTHYLFKSQQATTSFARDRLHHVWKSLPWFLAIGAFCCGVATSGAAERIDVPLGQRQLFLDDCDIAKLENLQRTMHQPAKKGAVVAPDQPWERWVQTRCSPAWDEKERIFKLWPFVCPPDRHEQGGTTYLESKDGVHWTKPSLGQREYAGSKENNFVTTDPKLPWGPNCIEGVVYDPRDPDSSRRYKGLMGAEHRVPVVSPDGIHWKQLDAAKLTSGDEGNLCYDPVTEQFIATLKTFPKSGRAHAIWTSKDFIHWTRLPEIFEADDEDRAHLKEVIEARLADATLQGVTCVNPADYHVDVYNLGLFRYEGLYVGLPAMYYATGKDRAGTNTDGFHLIELACSRDLKHWERLGDRRPFIGHSPMDGNAYDLTQLLPGGAPLVMGDELWFYYTGLKYREPPTDEANQGAVCLAVLRRDGFISLDAGKTQGTLQTKPFEAQGVRLCVNVDASSGSLGVEVLDSSGIPVAESEAINGNQPHGTAAWKSGNWATLKGQTVSLRFRLQTDKTFRIAKPM